MALKHAGRMELEELAGQYSRLKEAREGIIRECGGMSAKAFVMARPLSNRMIELLDSYLKSGIALTQLSWSDYKDHTGRINYSLAYHNIQAIEFELKRSFERLQPASYAMQDNYTRISVLPQLLAGKVSLLTSCKIFAYEKRQGKRVKETKRMLKDVDLVLNLPEYFDEEKQCLTACTKYAFTERELKKSGL
jgi:hypothetical protein